MKKTKNTPEKKPDAQSANTPAPMLDLSGGQKWTPPERGIGERIKEARQRPENGLSVEALSRMCKLSDPEGQGVSRTTLLRYESGTILPGARELRILCHALNVSPNWLLTGFEGERAPNFAEAMVTLVRLVEDRMAHENPLKWRATSGDVVRSMALEKAKEPSKR